jgi:hypothetical protein
LRAAALHRRFYADGFTRRMLSFAARSAAIRGVLGDLVLGDQGYAGLKRRLLRTGPAVRAAVRRVRLPRGLSGRPRAPPVSGGSAAPR